MGMRYCFSLILRHQREVGFIKSFVPELDFFQDQKYS